MTTTTIDRTEQGKRIKAARRYKGYSLKYLSEAVSDYTGLSISHQIIHQIENGNRGVFTEEMDALSAILEQPRTWLEGVTDDGFNTQAMGVYLSSDFLPAA